MSISIRSIPKILLLIAYRHRGKDCDSLHQGLFKYLSSDSQTIVELQPPVRLPGIADADSGCPQHYHRWRSRLHLHYRSLFRPGLGNVFQSRFSFSRQIRYDLSFPSRDTERSTRYSILIFCPCQQKLSDTVRGTSEDVRGMLYHGRSDTIAISKTKNNQRRHQQGEYRFPVIVCRPKAVHDAVQIRAEYFFHLFLVP